MKRIFKRSLCALLASAAVMVGTFSANAEGNVELPFVPYTPIEDSKRPYDDKIPADLYAEMEKAEPGQLIGSAEKPVIVYLELPNTMPDIANYMRMCIIEESLVRRGVEISWEQQESHSQSWFSENDKRPDIKVPGGRDFYENKVYPVSDFESEDIPEEEADAPRSCNRGYIAARLTAEQISALAELDDVICFEYRPYNMPWDSTKACVYHRVMHFTSEDALTLLRGDIVTTATFSTGDLDEDEITTSNDALLALRESVGLEKIESGYYYDPATEDKSNSDTDTDVKTFVPGENETPILKV